MGLLDDFSESPEQEKDRRATKEGLREAREGGAFRNLLSDISDELTHGRDYLDRKVATREGAKERGDTPFENLTSDIHDELVHGSKFVARKRYYREGSESPSSVEENSDYGGGGGGGGGAAVFGGEAIGKAVLIAFLVIVFFIVCIPLGLFLQWKHKRDAIATIGTVRMNVSIRGKDIDERGVMRYAHGKPQTFDIYVNWGGPLFESEKPLRVTVSDSRIMYYDRTWKHGEIRYFDRFACEVTSTLPVGRYVAQASVEGAPPARYAFIVKPRPPGNIFISETPPQWPRHDITTLQLHPGENKKIFAYVYINGTIPADGRTVYIRLVHEGAALFNYSNHVTEQNRNFYIPYEANFSEGEYTATLSADGEPPTERAFTVQYPKLETQEEKNQRVQRMLDNILPGGQQHAANSNSATTEREDTKPAETVRTPVPAAQRQDCYDGAWKENESNQFVWNFRRYGNTLRIVRNDRFAKGEFQKTPDGWIGFLSWGNGTIWKGVVLHEANDSCDEITTNQRWWYRR